MTFRKAHGKRRLLTQKNKMKKRGVFFTTDALIALIIIFLFIVVAIPVMRYNVHEKELHRDILETISTTKGYQLNSPGSVIQILITNKIITIDDLDKALIELIGELYVTYPNNDYAKQLADSILDPVDAKENIGIWYGDELIASKNVTPFNSSVRNVDVAREIVSGLVTGQNITGYSARAALANNLESKYYFFGGYYGEGNMSFYMNLTGLVKSAGFEMVINNNFSLYINGKKIGDYGRDSGANDKIPYNYTLSAGSLSNFTAGMNIIELKGFFNSPPLYIAGGFFKVSYENGVRYERQTRKYFPGVYGIPNIFDGLSIPGTLKFMNIYLNYSGSAINFLRIGNVTVYSEAWEGERNYRIYDFDLRQNLSYAALSNTTTPVRLQVGVSSTTGEGAGDVVLVTDYSGSMKKAINNVENMGNNAWNAPADCGMLEIGTAPASARRASLAECLDYIFVRQLMNTSGNKLWPIFINAQGGSNRNKIIAFTGDPTNAQQINDSITNNLGANGNGETCLACSINKGYDILKANGASGRRKFIVLMTDGVPTHCATGSPTCRGNLSDYLEPADCGGYCDGSGSSCSYEGCGVGNECADAVGNTIYAANRSKNDLNVTIYTIGFGITGCNPATNMLQQVAAMTGGKFYASSNVTELVEIYKNISGDIKRIVYEQQTVVSGPPGKLYPDSYIEYEYDAEYPNPYGLIVKVEKPFNNANSGTFSVPDNSSLLDLAVVSYSGNEWTNNVSINGEKVFNIKRFAGDLRTVGDPYFINIPLNKTKKDNLISVDTITYPENIILEGSIYNKIIYTIVKSFNGYSSISSSAIGCTWNIEFEDGGANLVVNIPSTYDPSAYPLADVCQYTLANHDPRDKDAFQIATYNLLKSLDLDNDGKVDTRFDEQNIEVSVSEVKGIPFRWQTEVQIRTWQ